MECYFNNRAETVLINFFPYRSKKKILVRVHETKSFFSQEDFSTKVVPWTFRKQFWKPCWKLSLKALIFFAGGCEENYVFIFPLKKNPKFFICRGCCSFNNPAVCEFCQKLEKKSENLSSFKKFFLPKCANGHIEWIFGKSVDYLPLKVPKSNLLVF